MSWFFFGVYVYVVYVVCELSVKQVVESNLSSLVLPSWLAYCLANIPGIFSLYSWRELQHGQVWLLSLEERQCWFLNKHKLSETAADSQWKDEPISKQPLNTKEYCCEILCVWLSCIRVCEVGESPPVLAKVQEHCHGNYCPAEASQAHTHTYRRQMLTEQASAMETYYRYTPHKSTVFCGLDKPLCPPLMLLGC